MHSHDAGKDPGQHPRTARSCRSAMVGVGGMARGICSVRGPWRRKLVALKEAGITGWPLAESCLNRRALGGRSAA